MIFINKSSTRTDIKYDKTSNVMTLKLFRKMDVRWNSENVLILHNPIFVNEEFILLWLS